MLIGEIAEIMVFDRALPKAEQEMVEGYLAHKWGIVDDLAQTGFKVARGLKLYYPFNETDGTIAQDYSTEMRHAEVIEAELNVNGKFGSGVRFYEPGDVQHNAKVDLLQNELEIDSWHGLFQLGSKLQCRILVSFVMRLLIPRGGLM